MSGIRLGVKEHGLTVIVTVKDFKTVGLPLRVILMVLVVLTSVVLTEVLASAFIVSPFKTTVKDYGVVVGVLYSY